jgi:hypothetical protein
MYLSILNLEFRSFPQKTVYISLKFHKDVKKIGLDRGREFFSSPPCPERICGKPSLLSNGYQRLFSRE